MLSPLTPLRLMTKLLARLRATEAPTPAEPHPDVVVQDRSDGRIGKYDDALTAVVARQPGVSVADAASAIGVPATTLYPVIRRLQSRNLLVKRGRELHPPDRSDAQRRRAGKHDERLIAIVNNQPGLTVAEAAALLDVHPTALYPVIRRLEATGALVKLGRELHPR